MRNSRDGNTISLKYRLDVIGCRVTDVVRSIGGWLYDRAMAGWEVNVMLPRISDARPLQILGARMLGAHGDVSTTGLANHGLAVSADVFAQNAAIRKTVLEALDSGLTEVTLWGDSWPVRVQRGLGAVDYRLSGAARAFKHQALAAAQLPHESVGLLETFFTDRRSFSPLGSELISAG
ncbi:hypothetical protein [Mycobacterium botniense]|nr:hypothetical protein [Mycobacterium botniense]